MSSELNEKLGTTDVVWNLNDLYESTEDELIRDDVDLCEQEAGLLAELAGQLAELEPAKFARTVKRLERIAANLGRLTTYAYLNFSTNIKDAGAGAFLQEARETDSRVRRQTIFFDLESDYDYVWRDEGRKGHRLSMSPHVTLPLRFSRYVEFEPWLNYTYGAQWFDEGDLAVVDHQLKRAYEIGARISANMERIYDFEWRHVKKLRHRIRPVLSYEYRVHQDDEEYMPWFEVVDNEGSANRITLTLEDFLDARLEKEQGSVTYRQWATFDLSQGYDIDDARGDGKTGGADEPFAPLSALLTVTPFPGFDLRGNVQWDHYDHHVPYTTLSAEVSLDRSGGRKDTCEIDYQYVKDTQENVNFRLDINLAYRFSAGGSLERDLGFGENISESYWLEYESQCWAVRVVAEREDEDTRAAVVFSLLGLGDIEAF